MSRSPWGHVSRKCVRCGKVGPRMDGPNGGYIHKYCLWPEELRERRKADQQARQKVKQ